MQAFDSPRLLVLALVLAGTALLLPADWTAQHLAHDAAHLPAVLQGVWIFKAVLLLHALIAGLLARVRAPQEGAALVAASTQDRTFRKADFGALAALIALGAALRLYDLGTGLWFDEIQTLVSYARLPLHNIISTFDSQNQHMLYSILAGTSLQVFGESAWALRLPAALLGVGSLAAMYWFARDVADRREALIATAVLTVSYHHVWFSQNARGYTGLLLGTLVGTTLLLRMLSNDYRRGWGIATAYAAVMALANYVHITAAFVLLSHALIWIGFLLTSSERKGRPLWVPLLGFLLAGTFTLQLYAFVLPQFVGTLVEPTMEGTRTQWKDPVWMVMETLRGLTRGVPGGWLALLLGAGIFAAGVISFARQRIALAVAMLLAPALLGSALIALEHNLWPRFFFFAAGFGVLIVVRGVRVAAESLLRARGPQLALASLAGLVLLSAAMVPAAYRPKQDYVAAQRFIESQRREGDAVVTVDMSDYALNTYAGADYLAVHDDAELREIEQAHSRTWLLYTFPTRLAAVQPEMWARLNTEYQSAAEFPGSVGGGTIFIKVKP